MSSPLSPQRLQPSVTGQRKIQHRYSPGHCGHPDRFLDLPHHLDDLRLAKSNRHPGHPNANSEERGV